MKHKIPILSSTLSGTPDAFVSLPSCLFFRPVSSRVGRAGLRRVLSRARVSEFRATDDRGDPELERYLLGKKDTGVLFSLVLEVCLGDLASRRGFLLTGFILQ